MSAARATAGSAVAESDKGADTCVNVTDESPAMGTTPNEQAPLHVALEPDPCDGTFDALCEAASASRHMTGHTAASNPTNRRMTITVRRVMPERHLTPTRSVGR